MRKIYLMGFVVIIQAWPQCASNHAASENSLLAALDHPHEGVGVAAASNPNASEKVLLKAASSPHYMVSCSA